jgi:hypothetical protein
MLHITELLTPEATNQNSKPIAEQRGGPSRDSCLPFHILMPLLSHKQHKLLKKEDFLKCFRINAGVHLLKTEYNCSPLINQSVHSHQVFVSPVKYASISCSYTLRFVYYSIFRT